MTRFELLSTPYNTRIVLKDSIKGKLLNDKLEVTTDTKKFVSDDYFKFIKINVKQNLVHGELQNGEIYKFKMKKLLKVV
jgi:hypothetical protein